jgi:hypothetical protein
MPARPASRQKRSAGSPPRRAGNRIDQRPCFNLPGNKSGQAFRSHWRQRKSRPRRRTNLRRDLAPAFRTSFLFTMSNDRSTMRSAIGHRRDPRDAMTHSCLQTSLGHRCSPNNDRPNQISGGARRDRTDDLMLAKHALSQLSYGPGALPQIRSTRKPADKKACGACERPKRAGVVGLGGLEPPTSRLSSARSDQLSYKPEHGSNKQA